MGSRPRALDLYCGAGGVSLGLVRAGFDVVGVDSNPMVARHYLRGLEHHALGRASFVLGDALSVPLEGFQFVWASPPCQAHTSLRHLTKGKTYPDLIPATRERLQASGIPYCIENVPGAPLASPWPLLLLCGSMFGLQTLDGRAELRRHRWFETSWPIALRPACQHGHAGALSVSGHSYMIQPSNWGKRAVLTLAGEHPNDPAERHRKRRALSVSGNTPQTNVVRNQVRETFSIHDARHAMAIDWMPMAHLSQAIPPPYAEWIGRQARLLLGL